MDKLKISKCRSCGAPIVWITTTNGKAMPCDARERAYIESGDKKRHRRARDGRDRAMHHHHRRRDDAPSRIGLGTGAALGDVPAGEELERGCERMSEYETREELIRIIESHAHGIGCEISCSRGHEHCENCEMLADDILGALIVTGKEGYSDYLSKLLAIAREETAKKILQRMYDVFKPCDSYLCDQVKLYAKEWQVEIDE